MAALIASALALAACAKIEQITLTQMQNNHDSSVGAVLGGLGGVGVGVGSLIGRHRAPSSFTTRAGFNGVMSPH